jgi:SAM-dependent methyltransferase
MQKLHELRLLINESYFKSGLLAFLVNPFYIIRSALYRGIKEHAPVMKGSVLDFGCGSKPYEKLFSNVQEYIGCDVKISGHDHAQSKVDYFYDGKSLPFENSRFDGVVAFEVFEHIFNLEDMLKEINRVMRPGGCLLISIPFAWGEHEQPFDYARYSSFGIAHLIRQSGFQILSQQKTGTFVLALWQLLIDYLLAVLPRQRKFQYFFQITVFMPLTGLGLLLNRVLPKSDRYYCNSIVLAKKLS